MKKKLLQIFIFLSLFLMTSSFVMHEYYVSITNILVNQESNQLEIEVKIDAEDLEHLLQKNTPIFNIEKIDKDNKILIDNYLKNNFSIWVNGSIKQLDIIGVELKPDGDFIYYSLIDLPSILHSIKIKNELLLPAFLQQHNIVNIKANQQTQSHTYIHQHTLHTFKIDAK